MQQLHVYPHKLSPMVGRAKSIAKKAQIAREIRESLHAVAVDAYLDEQAKPAGIKRKGAQKVVNDVINAYRMETGKTVLLNYSTVLHLARGERSRAMSNASPSWLTAEETKIVIQEIGILDDQGFPLSHRRLKAHVDKVLREKLGRKFPERGVGKQWTNRFVQKYSARIKMSWATSLESKRGRAVNEHTIGIFYDLLRRTTAKYDIVPELTWGVDEVGTNTLNGERERVMGAQKNGPQYQQQSGSRENIMIIETICADGSTIPPAVIFKGAAFQVKWKQDNPARAM